MCDKCAKNQEDKNACLVLPAAALSRASLFYCFFFTFQLFHLRTIHTTGDISTPIMNWKPPSSTPFSQQHYQSLAKSARQETLYLNFYDHFPTYDFVFFQLHHCRVVRATGDISAPRMNGQLVAPLLCHQQHYQQGRI